MRHSPAVLTIDLAAAQANYKTLQNRVAPGCRAGAVVKANGYGLGAAQMARAFIEACARDIFVSSLEEGIALRESLNTEKNTNQNNDLSKDIKLCKIYILNGFYASGAAEYVAHNLVPVLGSFMEIEAYKKLGAGQGRKLPAWLNFNTRMNRLGLGSVETEKLLGDMSMLDEIDVTGIKTHLACADDPAHPMNETQLKLFEAIAKHFPVAEKSLANSSGIFLGQKFHFNLVRPGMALYGLNPTPQKPNPMRPVISLKAAILRTRLVYKDASVGYGATYTFDKDTWIATVAAGYADGIFWRLGNKGALYWKGHKCPIRGRVSMDLTTVDLSAVPEKDRPKPGDFMELIGEHQTADDLAADAGTIGYEILTSLGSRYEREYVNA